MKKKITLVTFLLILSAFLLLDVPKRAYAQEPEPSPNLNYMPEHKDGERSFSAPETFSANEQVMEKGESEEARLAKRKWLYILIGVVALGGAAVALGGGGGGAGSSTGTVGVSW